MSLARSASTATNCHVPGDATYATRGAHPTSVQLRWLTISTAGAGNSVKRACGGDDKLWLTGKWPHWFTRDQVGHSIPSWYIFASATGLTLWYSAVHSVVHWVQAWITEVGSSAIYRGFARSCRHSPCSVSYILKSELVRRNHTKSGLVQCIIHQHPWVHEGWPRRRTQVQFPFNFVRPRIAMACCQHVPLPGIATLCFVMPLNQHHNTGRSQSF
jgi:hypothetical protein